MPQFLCGGSLINNQANINEFLIILHFWNTFYSINLSGLLICHIVAKVKITIFNIFPTGYLNCFKNYLAPYNHVISLFLMSLTWKHSTPLPPYIIKSAQSGSGQGCFSYLKENNEIQIYLENNKLFSLPFIALY